MPPHHSHKARRKRAAETSTSHGTTILDHTSKHEKPGFPLVAFFWPIKGANITQWLTLPCILMVAFLYRWCTAIWPYSGYQQPPMHGDFEAQRHWMELTINLPMTHWYFHDLEWWGLDYPPLTAYHSWTLGQVGSFLHPQWFQLYLSRGLDDPDLKVFMRATVAVSEYVVYVPAAVLCARQLARLYNINAWENLIALAVILLQPATILIDHGHFQYNTVMLGFALAALASMLADRPLWSCVFFVGALGFKQMALFFAPAVAAYLAGICIFPKLNIVRFVGIAVVTITSFAMLFLPLLAGTAYDNYRHVQLPSDVVTPPLLASIPVKLSEKAWYYPYLLQLAQAIHRIFPFARGLFEDKVANVWCAVHSSGIHKLNRYDSGLLSQAALGLTLASIGPPCAIIFFKPRKMLVLYAFAATAWGFFLCSYQVHEKNVLLPLLPMTMLIATGYGMKPSTRAWIGYANILACWTLFPLLVRDGLRIPYFVLTGLWAYLMGLPSIDISAYTTSGDAGDLHVVSKLIHLGTYVAMALWHVAEVALAPPKDKPDLWVVANVCIGAVGFSICYLWCLWRLIEESELLYDLKLLKRKTEMQKKTQ